MFPEITNRIFKKNYFAGARYFATFFFGLGFKLAKKPRFQLNPNKELLELEFVDFNFYKKNEACILSLLLITKNINVITNAVDTGNAIEVTNTNDVFFTTPSGLIYAFSYKSKFIKPKFLCIGGPFDGEMKCEPILDYMRYNRHERIRDTYTTVLLHKQLFLIKK